MLSKVLLLTFIVVMTSCGWRIDLNGTHGAPRIKDSAVTSGGVVTYQQMFDSPFETVCLGNFRIEHTPDSWSSPTSAQLTERQIAYADAAHCSSRDETAATIQTQQISVNFEDLDVSSVTNVGTGQFFISRTELVGGGSPVDVLNWYDDSTRKVCLKQITLGENAASVLASYRTFIADPENNADLCMSK